MVHKPNTWRVLPNKLKARSISGLGEIYTCSLNSQ